ncbi:hypothetical protein ACHWQZ_G008326 [Mnemiopsis leidyi]
MATECSLQFCRCQGSLAVFGRDLSVVLSSAMLQNKRQVFLSETRVSIAYSLCLSYFIRIEQDAALIEIRPWTSFTIFGHWTCPFRTTVLIYR